MPTTDFHVGQEVLCGMAHSPPQRDCKESREGLYSG